MLVWARAWPGAFCLAVLLGGAACSVNHAGLLSDGGVAGDVAGGGGHGEGGGGGAGGTTGGVVGTGATAGGGGVAGVGVAGDGGGGVAGGGGITGGAGTTGGGGTGGGAGTAGGGGTTGGTSGTSCAAFPQARAFVAPTDGLTHCYWTHREELDWPNSIARCASEQGTLVSILSEAENAFVLQLIEDADLFPAVSANARITLGGTDDKAGDDRSGPGTYRWITGEPWGYENWNSTGGGNDPDGECISCSPGNVGCHCSHRTTMGPSGRWYDRWESEPRRFLCEALAR